MIMVKSVPVTFVDFCSLNFQLREGPYDFNRLLAMAEYSAARKAEGRILLIGSCKLQKPLFGHGIYYSAYVCPVDCSCTHCTWLSGSVEGTVPEKGFWIEHGSSFCQSSLCVSSTFLCGDLYILLLKKDVSFSIHQYGSKGSVSILPASSGYLDCFSQVIFMAFHHTLISLLNGFPRAVGPSLLDSLLNANTTITSMYGSIVRNS